MRFHAFDLRGYSSRPSWLRPAANAGDCVENRSLSVAILLVVFSAYDFVGPPCLARPASRVPGFAGARRSASGRRSAYWNSLLGPAQK